MGNRDAQIRLAQAFNLAFSEAQARDGAKDLEKIETRTLEIFASLTKLQNILEKHS